MKRSEEDEGWRTLNTNYRKRGGDGLVMKNVEIRIVHLGEQCSCWWKVEGQ